MTCSSQNPSSVECNMNIAGLTVDSFKLRNTKIPIQTPNKRHTQLYFRQTLKRWKT